ncbi:MAG: pyridoxal phosphate-dependent aminotransferase [Rhodobacteraceae bacterium]|nr:pyridoxal phosphate-dependent aminotransferase [Paracoccaceae bacterium]
MANFDEMIDRRGTHSAKWDVMEAVYGVSPEDGLSMWVADMDFRPPQAVTDTLQAMTDHGVHGYYAPDTSYKAAVCGWMQRRHGWEIKPEWISTTHGLVAAVALALQAYTEKGDGVILFTPVYHAFAKMINSNERKIVEAELALKAGRYELDLASLEAALDGSEKMVILCSPHNPGGRVWSGDELRTVADFCVKHDLILVSDEIHHDLVFAPHKHTMMALAAPEIADRLVTLVAASKTFNLAGGMTGVVVISDDALRARFAKAHQAAGASPNRFGMMMTEAAYTEGESWLEELLAYLTENKRVFDEGVNAIPGLRSMNLESTYLAWVDFSGTGMDMPEVIDRVQSRAKIAANYGETFGKGGEKFLRFNLGCPREMVEDAVSRLQLAFADLQ